MVIHSYEIERFCLATLLKYPKLFVEVEGFVNEYDFVSRLNRTVFSVIKGFITKGEDLNDFLIAEKIKNLNIRFEETDLEPMDYLETLRLLQVNEQAGIGFFKKLKQISVRREIDETARKIQEQMRKADDATLDQVVSMADEAYNGRINMYEVNQDFEDIYESLAAKIEERGENPVDEIGFMGPFAKWNELYGSSLRDGAVTVLGARTGVGKTTMGMFYLNHVAEKYQVPILHLDQGEMSLEELQYRAVCMFTQGRVSYDALEHGYWRKSKEMTELVRSVWPRVEKLKMYYYDVSNLNPDEIHSLIRRFYLRKIGRGNKFLTHYDYLKRFDVDDPRNPAWQIMGRFLKHTKNLYKNELHNAFWTSVQMNRSGIVRNKTAETIDDTENTFGVDDSIVQQATHGILVRDKLPEEMAFEHSRFGNLKALFVKTRHLGRNAQDALRPIRMPDGRLTRNFLHLQANGFHIEERGDLASTLGQMGDSIRPPNDPADPLEDVNLE